MSKNKLAKFADMASYSNVVEAPFQTPESPRHPLYGNWHNEFFHNNNPIVLELGCGRGEYCVGLGRMFPHVNFIGVDIKGARMWSGATDAVKEGLTNVGFLRTHIEFIDNFFAPGEIAEIWLTFSDPQMKKVTKRLTSTYFLQRYRHFLADNGTIHLKTDSNFLFTYTDYVVRENNLPVLFRTDDLYHTLEAEKDDAVRSILGIHTYYEDQWLSRGLTIKYLKFSLPQMGTLVEPDVEIEMDSYRSYNRSKRSGCDTSK